jgi:hypothetical protein
VGLVPLNSTLSLSTVLFLEVTSLLLAHMLLTDFPVNAV